MAHNQAADHIALPPTVQVFLDNYERTISGARALAQEYGNDVDRLAANYPLSKAGQRFLKTFTLSFIPGASFVEGTYDYWWVFGNEVCEVTFAVALIRGYDIRLATVKLTCYAIAMAAIYPGNAGQVAFVEGSGYVLEQGLFYAWDHIASFQRFWALLNGLSYAIYVMPIIGATIVSAGRFAALKSLIGVLKRVFPVNI